MSGDRLSPRRVRAAFSAIFRSERHASIILLAAALVGLLIANGPLGARVLEAKNAELPIPALGLSLTAGEWIADLLLAVFFFVVAVELKTEFRVGELNSIRKALVPTVAAAGGIIVPALVFLLIAGTVHVRGWPVPTATDIAFAVGVLATFGRHLPSRMRVFLLALAVIDDLVGIILIAILFTDGIDLGALLLAALAGAVFAVVARIRRGSAAARVLLLILLSLTVWYLVHEAGVHPTIAGVAIGLLMPSTSGEATARILAPWSAGLILPIFALTASLVVIPTPDRIGPVFFALAIALPVGKAVGITAGGLLGAWIARRQLEDPVVGWDLVALAFTGGIGFTVALLMGQLAFEGDQALIDQSTLGVLVGSAAAILIGGVLISARSRVHRDLRRRGEEAPEILVEEEPHDDERRENHGA